MPNGLPVQFWHLAFSAPSNWLPHSVYRLGQNGSALRRCDADCNLLSMLDTEAYDAQPVYTGLAHEDIAKRLQGIFGSAFTSSRGGELSSLCWMVYDQQDVQLQEASLRTIRNNQAILTGSHMLIRSFTRLWLSGRGTKQGQAGHGAAAPVLNLAEADGAASAISTRRTAGKKTKKRPQKSTKHTGTEAVPTAAAHSSIMADNEHSTSTAIDAAGPGGDLAAEISEQHARANSEAPVTATQLGAQPGAAVQEEVAADEAGSGDDDMDSLISTFTQQRQQQQRRPIQCRVPSANAQYPRCVKTLSLT